jgi:hypothetical protein
MDVGKMTTRALKEELARLIDATEGPYRGSDEAEIAAFKEFLRERKAIRGELVRRLTGPKSTR